MGDAQEIPGTVSEETSQNRRSQAESSAFAPSAERPEPCEDQNDGVHDDRTAPSRYSHWKKKRSAVVYFLVSNWQYVRLKTYRHVSLRRCWIRKVQTKRPTQYKFCRKLRQRRCMRRMGLPRRRSCCPRLWPPTCHNPHKSCRSDSELPSRTHDVGCRWH